MNTDDLDRDLYRQWWEAEGRSDLGTCPCGNEAGDLELNGEVVIQQVVPGLCPRHFGYGWDTRAVYQSVRLADVPAEGLPVDLPVDPGGRERFAQWIIDGTFHERDLTEREAGRAGAVASGNDEGMGHGEPAPIPAVFGDW